MVGQTLGSYRILSQLGAGAMGEVFLAEHRHLKRKAAVKLLARELVSRPELLERFFLEARATSAIAHPGIVQIFDCEVDATGRPYIVMEHLTGDTLATVLGRRGALPATLAARLARGIAEALGAAHAKEIVHRDLKPENIFVEGDPPDSIKLVDFGIAKLAGDIRAAQVHQTRTGALMGTPLYMSPEQCRDSGKTDLRTDVYSLGCVMFEMLTGRPPFTQTALGELVVAHLTEQPKEARAVNPTVPAELSDLVAALLQKDPAARPPSMRAVAERLESFLSRATTLPSALSETALAPPPRSSPTHAPSSSPSSPAPTHSTLRESAAELVAGAPWSSSPDAIPARSGRAPLIIGGLVAAAAAIAIAAAVNRPRPAPVTPASAANGAPGPTTTNGATKDEAVPLANRAPPPPAQAAPHAAAAPAPPSAAIAETASKHAGHGKHAGSRATPPATAAAPEPPSSPAATAAAAPAREASSPADLAGAWEGPWNDVAHKQKGRLFIQVAADGGASGWMFNTSAQQSFRMIGRLASGGALDLTCQCPPQQGFAARGAVHGEGSGATAELKTTLSLSSSAGVFGQAHATLHRSHAR